MLDKHVCALTNVTKIYDEKLGTPILSDVDITIAAGELTGIIGASGSGKTTLLNLLGLLDKPSHGTYILDGINLEDIKGNYRAEIRREKIAFIFQSFYLLQQFSVLDNVALPLVYRGHCWRAARDQARASLIRVGLNGMEQRRTLELSGGQQQRVAIARAIICQPRLLLADEPTGNLDPKTADEIIALFEQIKQTSNIAVVVVTHDPRVANKCQQVYQVDAGSVQQLH